MDYDSSDELPPISSVATSESEGIASDERMDVDNISDRDSASLDGINDSGSDGEYVEHGAEADSDANSEDEQDEAALYREFLEARKRAKAGTMWPKKALSKSSAVTAPPPKRQPPVKVSVFLNMNMVLILLIAACNQQVGSTARYH